MAAPCPYCCSATTDCLGTDCIGLYPCMHGLYSWSCVNTKGGGQHVLHMKVHRCSLTCGLCCLGQLMTFISCHEIVYRQDRGLQALYSYAWMLQIHRHIVLLQAVFQCSAVIQVLLCCRNALLCMLPGNPGDVVSQLSFESIAGSYWWVNGG